VTIKSLLFCLFLYVCLVWVAIAYMGHGTIEPDGVRLGLLWTGIGLIALLAWIIGARLFGWWRLSRAKAAAKPAPASKPTAAPSHPDDEAMKVLIAEAETALAKASASGRRAGVPFSAMPLYLLVGAEGSGKTSTLLNSGIEPQLLAGQGTAPVAPTRLCNFWLAKDVIFAEIAGRQFAGDLNRWGQLLGVLRGQSAVPFWRRLWGEQETRRDLRGVIAFCDSKELTTASSDPQRLEAYSRAWQERLRSIAEVFGVEFPVYLIITKCDKIPFFSDYFRRLPESEISQILGCNLALRDSHAARSDEVFAEAEAKRLTASFRPLYHSLARRRITQLAHEPNLAQRAGVYEFPRELKRIRSPLVQFLTDVFRPNSLGLSPLLRGYYLTGVREGEVQFQASAAGISDSTEAPHDATKLFRPRDATQLFQGTRKSSGMRWLFVSDIFHRVILQDQPPRPVKVPVDRFDQQRKIAFGAVCGICGVLFLAFVISWWNNRSLLSDIGAAFSSKTDPKGRPTQLQDLQALEKLRVQLARLEGGLPWRFHWGLYTGNRVLDRTRSAYFNQFKKLLLNDLNAQMVADLRALSPNPDAAAPYDPPYNTLRAHLMISSGSCAVETGFLSNQLKEVRGRMVPAAPADWQREADRQTDFYGAELARGHQWRVTEDSEGRERARQYLGKVRGIDRLYQNILANIEKKLGKGVRLSDLADNYTQVLSGPNEVRAAFSPAGWDSLEKASTEVSSAALGEPCVMGGGQPGVIASFKQDSQTTQAIQRMYLRDYAESWRKFVEGFSVTKYASAADAARKLEVLADRKSPLLAVFVMSANATNFPTAAAQADTGIGQIVSKVTGVAKKAEADAKKAISTPTPQDPLSRPADIPQYFQPVHVVEPPGGATWISEKNTPYMDALSALRQAMLDIVQKGSDPAVHLAAGQSYDKAMAAASQISRGFNAVGVGNLDATAAHLLEEPIRNADRFIIRNPIEAGAGKVNGDLRAFCSTYASVFRKYPFRTASTEDVTLDEFAAIFQPATGSIWKLQQQSLAEYVVKEGGQWKAKDPAKKPQVTEDLLRFLNGAESTANAFYPGGAAQPQLTYVLRPQLEGLPKDTAVELEIDGQLSLLTVFQKPFTWPSPPGTKRTGAVARLHSAISVAFASRPGVWGIFRIFGDAEPRALKSKLVVWKYTTGGVGRLEPIQPAPVQLEIVQFPGGQDVFNPQYWEALRCPSVAVK
jgi:type VI secretion system protein ImpL